MTKRRTFGQSESQRSNLQRASRHTLIKTPSGTSRFVCHSRRAGTCKFQVDFLTLASTVGAINQGALSDSQESAAVPGRGLLEGVQGLCGEMPPEGTRTAAEREGTTEA